MATSKEKNLTSVVSESLKKSFDINAYKKSKFLDETTKFKEQKWIPFSPAVKDALSIPGIPMGHVAIARGGSDTGKTTLMIETAVSAQKMGILPVFIITEMKWDFAHAQTMGLELDAVPDEETGEVINYKGFFIYVDRSSLNTIEDVSAFIADTLNDQAKGKLPYDLLFLWDSVGSIPCEMSVGGRKVKYHQNPNFHVYHKFPNLKNVPELFTEEDEVVITRKMHGTNARYGIVRKKRLSLWDRVRKFFGQQI